MIAGYQTARDPFHRQRTIKAPPARPPKRQETSFDRRFAANHAGPLYPAYPARWPSAVNHPNRTD
jgi:hypothetical protein